MTKEQMDAIWRAPGVQNAGHLNLWSRDRCGLCAGNTSASKRDIVINLHGFRVGRAA